MAKKNIKIYNKILPLIVEKEENGFYIVECPLFDGCYRQGKTLDEVLINIREVTDLILEEKKTKERLKNYEPKGLSLCALKI